MKSCDEMVNSLLHRREKYNAEQKRKMPARIVISLCCVFFAVVMGFVFLQNNWIRVKQQVASNELTITGEKNDIPDYADNQAIHQSQNTIVFNRLDSVNSYMMGICLLWNDFVEMSIDEINQYYGIDVVPTLPDGIKAKTNRSYGIFKRDNGTGEIYWDQIRFEYANEDCTKIINVEVKKGKLPFFQFVFPSSSEEKSTINNVEVVLGEMDDGSLFAEFMYNNVGFYVGAFGISQDEFVNIVASLID